MSEQIEVDVSMEGMTVIQLSITLYTSIIGVKVLNYVSINR